VFMILILLTIVRFSRNSVEIVLNTKPGKLSWSPQPGSAVAVAVLFCICIFHIRSHSEFLYFQF
jgi:hypothetical protein